MADFHQAVGTAKVFLSIVALIAVATFASPYIRDGVRSVCGGSSDPLSCAKDAYQGFLKSRESNKLRTEQEAYWKTDEGKAKIAENTARFDAMKARAEKLGANTEGSSSFTSLWRALEARAKEMDVPVNRQDNIPQLLDRMEAAATQKAKQ